MYDGGEIIIVNNIIFNNNRADHASIKGRPCIVLSDYNDKMTMIPLTSSKPKSRRKNNYFVEIKGEDIESERFGFKSKKIEYSNVSSMFQKPLRHSEVLAYVKLKRYFELLKEIENMRLERNRLCSECYNEIYQDLEYQRKTLELIFKKN